MAYVVHRLANALVNRGHRVTVFSFDPGPADARYRVKQLPLGAWGEPMPGRLTLTPLMLNSLDLRAFDVMHAHGDDHFVVRRPVPWVRTLHGSAQRELRSAVRLRRRLSQSVLIPLEALSCRIADVTVGVSHDTAMCVPGIDEVIPNGVDLCQFRPLPGAKSCAPSILFVGTVAGRKRGRFLLDVFREHIRPVLPDAELWMVSETGEAMDGVRWCGKVSTEELIRLYQQAWVFCLPSTYEGFGVPYIEALACGTPVVASRNPGAREVLDEGRYGLLAADDELPHAILAILQDPVRQKELAHAGLIRANEYCLDAIAERYERVYERARLLFRPRGHLCPPPWAPPTFLSSRGKPMEASRAIGQGSSGVPRPGHHVG